MDAGDLHSGADKAKHNSCGGERESLQNDTLEEYLALVLFPAENKLSSRRTDEQVHQLKMQLR